MTAWQALIALVVLIGVPVLIGRACERGDDE